MFLCCRIFFLLVLYKVLRWCFLWNLLPACCPRGGLLSFVPYIIYCKKCALYYRPTTLMEFILPVYYSVYLLTRSMYLPNSVFLCVYVYHVSTSFVHLSHILFISFPDWLDLLLMQSWSKNNHCCCIWCKKIREGQLY